MADVTIRLRGENDTGQAVGEATQGLEKFGAESKKTGMSLTDLKAGLDMVVGAAQKAGEALKAAFDFAQLGATVIQTESSFTNLIDTIGAAPNLLQQLQDASGGTIDKLSLMSSTATLLAGTSGTLATSLANATPQLLEIARAANKLNPSLGDTAFLYESISKGIKRASPLILDNLGIVVKVGEANKIYAEELGKSVKELTAAEKTQALLNAALEAGGTLIEQAGGAAGNAVDDFSAFTASMTDLKNAAAAAFAESGVVQKTTSDWAKNADILTTILEAQRSGLITTAEAWDFFKRSQALGADAGGDMNKYVELQNDLLDELTDKTTEQAQETARLMNATTSASTATQTWAENTFYAEQAMNASTTATESYTGALFGLKSAIGQVYTDINFFKDASGLLNEAIKSQADSTSELNLRQIELLYVTGQITAAERDNMLAANEQIEKLETLNGALDTGLISWEQYLQVIADGKITIDEMTGAVSALWGTFLDNSLDAAAEDAAAMEEAIGDAYETMGSGEMFVPFAEKALAAGMALSTLAGGAGGLQPTMSTLDETIVTAKDDLEAMRDVMGDLEGMHQVGINVTVTGDPIPSIPGSTAPTGAGQGAVGFASGADFVVPPGYPNDSYGPLYVQSGEHVQVTPAGQSSGGAPTIIVMLDGQQIAAAIEIRNGQKARQVSGAYRP